MFPNEVIVKPEDKQELVALLTRANEILGKYPYDNGVQSHTVTTISRAKSLTREAKEWCGYLHTAAD